MTATPAYMIPDGSLDQKLMQEGVSKAYVNMIASAAGLTLLSWEFDMGSVDLTLKSLVDYQRPGGFQPQFDVQLKATTTISATQTNFSYQINRRTYENLSNPNRGYPACLGVLLLPADPVAWIHHDTQGLLSRSFLYWKRTSDFPPLPAGQSYINIPFTQADRFGPAELLQFMDEASRWGWQ